MFINTKLNSYLTQHFLSRISPLHLAKTLQFLKKYFYLLLITLQKFHGNISVSRHELLVCFHFLPQNSDSATSIMYNLTPRLFNLMRFEVWALKKRFSMASNSSRGRPLQSSALAVINFKILLFRLDFRCYWYIKTQKSTKVTRKCQNRPIWERCFG